jgi:hypothetical protein
MNLPSRRAPVLLLLLSLAACDIPPPSGSGTFRALLGDSLRDFEHSETKLLQTTPRRLVACGTYDPLPNAIDDETSLCLSLELDLAQLEAAGDGAAFAIEGTAHFSNAASPDSMVFAPEPGHSEAAIPRAWVSMSCYAPPRDDTLTQRFQGRLLLTRVTAESLSGRVEVSMEGELAGASCHERSGPANFDFLFTVQR